MFFGYKRAYSVIEMFCELNLPNFDAVLINGVSTFTRRPMSKHFMLLMLSKLNIWS